MSTPDLIDIGFDCLDHGREPLCDGCSHCENTTESHPYGNGSADEHLVSCNVDYPSQCPIIMKAMDNAQAEMVCPNLRQQMNRGNQMASNILEGLGVNQ